MNKLISVVMPVYNGEKYIRSCIESILFQTYKDFEFIIVDDGSTDTTKSILEEYAKKDSRIRLVFNDTNQGIAYSRNIGIKSAHGDLIANMDADDIAYVSRLQTQQNFMDKNPTVDICIGDLEVINDIGQTLYIRQFPKTTSAAKKALFRYCPVPNPVAMYKKDVWVRTRGYDESRRLDDMDFWFRALMSYQIGHVGEVLQKYRIHSDSLIHNSISIEKEILKIRLQAILKYKFYPSFGDFVFNVIEVISLLLIPQKYRWRVYELLRERKVI